MPTEPAPDAIAEAARELARGASLELGAGEVAALRGRLGELPAGTAVYVPAPPAAEARQMLQAVRLLTAAGLRPVPHLAARAIPSGAALRERLDALAEAGARALMLIAGDRERPAGPYRDTLDVLDSVPLAEYGFRGVGVAAYPEGHPRIAPEQLQRALERKAEYAAGFPGQADARIPARGMEDLHGMWIVTQFAFSPAPVLDWLEQWRRAGGALPVRIGIAAPTRLKKLLAFAARCGVGASLRMARGRPGVLRLLGDWTPDAPVRAFAAHRLRAPDAPLAGIHLFAFGGLAATLDWLAAFAAARAVAGTGDGEGANKTLLRAAAGCTARINGASN